MALELLQKGSVPEHSSSSHHHYQSSSALGQTCTGDNSSTSQLENWGYFPLRAKQTRSWDLSQSRTWEYLWVMMKDGEVRHVSLKGIVTSELCDVTAT